MGRQANIGPDLDHLTVCRDVSMVKELKAHLEMDSKFIPGNASRKTHFSSMCFSVTIGYGSEKKKTYCFFMQQ